MGTGRAKIRRLPVWGVSVMLLAAVLMGETVEGVTLNQEVSLDLANSSLSAALENLTRQTGYQFDLGDQWKDHPITLKVREISLQECLQRLLEPFNYAIVLESDEHIALNIFGEQTAVRALPATRVPLPRSNQVTRPAPPPEEEEEEEDEPEEEDELDEEEEEESELEEGEGDREDEDESEDEEADEDADESGGEESPGDDEQEEKPAAGKGSANSLKVKISE